MEIWIHRNGQFAGRFSESAIRDKVADGSFSPSDLAWNEAKSSWQPISELLAAVPAATPAPIEKEGASATEAKPPSHAAHRAAATEETKAADLPRPKPPPLPSTPPASAPVRAAGPPPLPAMTSPTFASGPGSSIPATITPADQPPEGETIWSPYVA